MNQFRHYAYFICILLMSFTDLSNLFHENPNLAIFVFCEQQVIVIPLKLIREISFKMSRFLGSDRKSSVPGTSLSKENNFSLC